MSTRFGDRAGARSPSTDGKVTDVAAVQVPGGNGRDQEINSYAVPVLDQEALAAQSADIDIVWGATVT